MYSSIYVSVNELVDFFNFKESQLENVMVLSNGFCKLIAYIKPT